MLIVAIAVAAFLSGKNYPAPFRNSVKPQFSVKSSPPPGILNSPAPTSSVPMIKLLPDTEEKNCFDNTRPIPCPGEDQPFFGQDAQYTGSLPQYTSNHDGTVTDKITGLMWQQDPGTKLTYQQALDKVKNFSLAGYNDWRLPTIKELYTLMNFNGTDPSAITNNDTSGLTPFINDVYFRFSYGNPAIGDRIIDSQWITGNLYVSKVFINQECFFGVNFADGRIKCYPTADTGHNNGYYLRLVRGDSKLTVNSFTAGGDGTVRDDNTGLTWQQTGSNNGMNWQDALAYCQNLTLAGQNDWRLPNAKELQSIVDYSRSPDTTNSPAIDPVFTTARITNEAGQTDYPYYWTSTTHQNTINADQAVYISFGRAMGYMNGRWMDVHGAGAQRSDPKNGDPSLYPKGRGPQGDAIRINNYVRCVRGGATLYISSISTPVNTTGPTPTPVKVYSPAGKQPPEEAIITCQNKTSGSACSFNTIQGLVTGTCKTTPGGQFACVPN